MAKGGKKPNTERKKDKPERRRSFWQNFFEPIVDEQEPSDEFDDPEEPELEHLFDDDEVEYSEEQDISLVDSLTWSDGEPVVEDTDTLEIARPDTGKKRRKADPEADEPDTLPSKRKRSDKARKTKKPKKRHGLFGGGDDFELELSDEESGEADGFDLHLPDEAQAAASPEAAEPYDGAAEAADNEATDAPAEYAETPADGEAAGGVESLFDEVDEPDGAFSAEPEEIRLFDDADDGLPREKASRSRTFRTGKTTATRIRMNVTSTARSVDEAKRLERTREAERQHQIYLEKQKKARKRKKMFRRLFGNAAFVLFVITAVVVALYFSFLLNAIEVSGNDTYPDDYITSLSGLQTGRHMLLCDLDAARTGISEDPYLQVDSITYVFPNRIRIKVTERKEVASIVGLDYNVVIDHNGYVLSMTGGTDSASLLQVSGVGLTGIQLGHRIGETDDFSTATMITMINKLEEYSMLEQIASIDLTTPLAISMVAQNGLKIHVGQPTDIDAKMLSLYRELPQFLRQNVNWGTLYLSAKGGTVYSPIDQAVAVLDTDTTADPDNPTATPDPNDPNATPQPSATPKPGGWSSGSDPFSG